VKKPTEIPEHVCAHCGHKWKEMTLDDAWHVIQAVQCNKQGPWCNLCHHLKFAEIFADHRKSSVLTIIRTALNATSTIHSPTH
jgi:hypothetical protein